MRVSRIEAVGQKRAFSFSERTFTLNYIQSVLSKLIIRLSYQQEIYLRRSWP